jgi:hypothetical protein
MHKSATKCNETIGKWYKNKHGASKIIDTFETYQYVDDVVVKTKQHGTLLDDLKETFANLPRFRMKLNPEKCTFGVPAGQLLGYLVS